VAFKTLDSHWGDFPDKHSKCGKENREALTMKVILPIMRA